MKTIKDIDIKDKVVLLRADYNVPIENGEVTSDLRIRASLPTLNYLRDHGAKKIIVISHLGRPNGIDPALSLKPVADILNDFLGRVQFVNDVAGPTVTAAVAKMHPGDILLLQNLRFYPGEKENDPAFIESIISSVHPDFYVQDGFAVTHRTHASTVAVKDFLPIYAGLLVDYEVTNLKQAIENPTRPLTLILGGGKVADKKPLINAFLEKADHILIGGKIAADGYATTSPNVTIATDFDTDGAGAKQDIGPVSTADFANVITDSATIIWNGLLGHAEDPAYATSSTIVAELLGEAKDKTTIICGGDTTGFVEHLMNEHDSLSYTLISTGGGAALEFLSGRPMPGLEAISA